MVKRVLNLGAGTQSSVLLLMADRGEIEPVDVAVFADTGWEPKAVYEHLEWLKGECKRTPIVTVSAGNIYDDALTIQVTGDKEAGRGRFGSMPLFVRNQDGSRGMIRRSCTKEYKKEPITRWIKTELLGLTPNSRWPKEHAVTQVYGISVDEHQRMRDPEGVWVRNEYPLVKMRWTRSRTVQWAEENYPGRTFPRSACIGCPFHSDFEWKQIKETDPLGWGEAVILDQALRTAEGMDGEVYLHSSLQPLEEIDFRSKDEKNGQQKLWDDECHGMCGV